MKKRYMYIMLLLILLCSGSKLSGQPTESDSSLAASKILPDKTGLRWVDFIPAANTSDILSSWNTTYNEDNLYLLDRGRLINTATTRDFDESQLRRFETVFFISLPVSFLLSFLSTILYREFLGKTESFTGQEYSYIFLSSIGISMNIAFRDNKIVFRQDIRRSREGY